MLSTVRLTWCMMDTADGAGRESERETSVRHLHGQDPRPLAGGRQVCYCCLELPKSLSAVAGLSRGQEIQAFAVCRKQLGKNKRFPLLTKSLQLESTQGSVLGRKTGHSSPRRAQGWSKDSLVSLEKALPAQQHALLPAGHGEIGGFLR